MVLVRVGIDTQRAGVLGGFIFLWGVGIVTQRVWDLGKDYGSVQCGDR